MKYLIFNILAFTSWCLFSWKLICFKRPPSIDYYELSEDGPPVFDELCSGKISIFKFVSSMRIQVYKSGILIKPIMTRNCFLHKEEISYFTSSFDNSYAGTEIVHTSPYLKSPLIINTTFDKNIKDLFK